MFGFVKHDGASAPALGVGTATLSRRRILGYAAAGGVGLLAAPMLGKAAFASGPTFPDQFSRFVWIDGAFNTRDFGGYAVGTTKNVAIGRLYRSSSLVHVSDAGLPALTNLKLGIVSDFRSLAEVSSQGHDRLPAGVINLPTPIGDPTAAGAVLTGPPPPGGFTSPDPGTLAEFESYITAPEARISLGVALNALAWAPIKPFMWHCNSGTYRTGWSTTVLLTLLGVARADVDADFLLSNPVFGVTYAFTEYLDAAFAKANSVYGSFDDYLHHGLAVPPATVNRLRQTLLV